MALQLVMTDKDVVERAYDIAGVGKMRQATQNELRLDGQPCKDKWVWWVGRDSGCEDLMAALQPLMGVRRSAKIQEILDAGLAHPRRKWDHGRSAFERKQCACDICREAFNARQRQQRANRKARRLNVE